MQCVQCEVSHSLTIQPFVVRDAHLIPLFQCLFAVEALATLSGMTATSAVVLYRKHLNVHINLRRIMINAALHYTMLAPSRLVIIALTINWQSNGSRLLNPSFGLNSRSLNILDSVGVWLGSFSFDTLNYNIVFRVFETLKNQYVLVAAFTLPAAAMERLCSVLLIADYECVPRTYISVAIMLVLDLFSFSQTFIMMFMGIVPVGLPFGLVGITNLIAIIVFRYCHSKTMRYYDDGLQHVKKMKTPYSLSLRFQILENTRVAKFVRGLYVLVALLSVITAAPLVLAMIFEDEIAVALFSEAYSLGIVIYANVVPSVVLFSIPRFREDVRKLCHRLSRTRIDSFEKENAREDAVKKQTAEEEANTYFVQLQSMWA